MRSNRPGRPVRTPARPVFAAEPTDPDIEDAEPGGGTAEAGDRGRGRAGGRPNPWHSQGPVVGAVSAGGVLGALARYGMGLGWPTPRDGFPWTTFTINVLGCFVIGVLLVSVTEIFRAHRLLRPFFGTGVLGGFTTFSTYCVDIQQLIENGRPGTAVAYLAATAVAALAAVTLAARLTRRLLGHLTKGTLRP
ncbi:fluoride efflux transporter CrcB [Streptomyces sp. NPDC049954]|uniref:fluoride efflux transporter CrcB n=1 Tax=Streptomyces sp. NPDC049954 TaxID=3155779 RepID=UPI003437F67A